MAQIKSGATARANEKRLIDANALQRLLLPIAMGLDKEYGSLGGAVSGVMMHIDNAPTVDAVEVVHGHWISDEADILFHCSVCETQISTSWDYDDLSWNYCPNCGAEMDGE